HYMLHQRSFLNNVQDLLQREILVMYRNAEFIENDHCVCGVREKIARRGPGTPCPGGVSLSILSLPGISFAHPQKCDLLTEAFQTPFLGRIDRALDELDHRHLHAVTKTT